MIDHPAGIDNGKAGTDIGKGLHDQTIVFLLLTS